VGSTLADDGRSSAGSRAALLVTWATIVIVALGSWWLRRRLPGVAPLTTTAASVASLNLPLGNTVEVIITAALVLVGNVSSLPA